GKRPNGRVLLYGSAVAVILIVTVIGLGLCLSESPLPNWLVNSRLASWIASRAGLHYTIRSLQIGCLQPQCSLQVQATGVEAELATTDPLRFHIDDVRWGLGQPLIVQGFEVRSGNSPAIAKVARIDSTLPQGSAQLEGIDVAVRPDGTS